jgi:hypothetical protein
MVAHDAEERTRMVLPTNEYADIRAWLAANSIDASEFATLLITRDLVPLLDISGSSFELPALDLALLDESRSWLSSFYPVSEGGHGPDRLYEACHRILGDVCRELGRVGIVTRPYTGLGRIRGNEILEGRIVIERVERLEALRDTA